MADIKVIYVNADGFNNEHSESSDSVKMLSFKTANHELTDTKLGALTSGGDISSTYHSHDAIYFRESEHLDATTGATDAGKPVKLSAAGYLNPLIDVSSLNSALDHGALTGLGDDDHTQYILASGTRAFSGAQSMGGFKLTSLADPSAGTDAVNLQTLQAYQQGLKPKAAVRVATTVAGTLTTSFEDGDTIDGIVLATGDRILIKDQASTSENGIYIVQASGAPVRATDFDSLTPIDEINGAYTAVQEGSANAGKSYVQQGTVGTIDTDPIVFVFFNAADSITASTGLTRVVNDIQLASSSAGAGLGFSAGILSVNVTGALEISADTVQVKADGINDTHIDFGTGVNQVSAVDLPIADAGNYFLTDNVEAALQSLAASIAQQGVEYTVGAGGVTKGDLVYISANNTVLPYSTLSSGSYSVGMALSTEAAAGTVKVLANDTKISGVLSGATAGTKYYWTGSALSASIPSGSGNNVWQAGVAINATDLAVEVAHVKKNA